MLNVDTITVIKIRGKHKGDKKFLCNKNDFEIFEMGEFNRKYE